METALLKRSRNLWDTIVASLLCLIILFSQLRQGQVLAVLATCLLFYVSFLRFTMRRHAVSSAGLVWCLLWVFMIVYLVRPAYVDDVETKIELSWLFIGLIMLMIALMNSGYTTVSTSALYDTALVGALLAIISMITKSTLGGLVSTPYAGTRYFGGFDGPNEMGAFYVLALSLMLAEHLLRRRVHFVWAKAGVFLIAIISTWSRSAFGALCVMYGLCFCSVYFQERRVSERAKVVVLFLLLSTLIAHIFVYIALPQYNIIRRSAGDRGYLMEITRAIVRQRPIWGHGLGSYWFLGDGTNATPHSEYLLFIISG
jgi:hypothetical protein